MVQVICFGLLVADCVTATVDALPERGTLALVDRVELHVGGCAANTAIALAKLGLSVGIIGGVGTDGLGDFVLGAVAGAGVDVRGVKRFADVPTAATAVCVHSDAERTFLHVPGANARFVSSDTDWSVTQGAAIFHIAGAQLMGALEKENGIVAVAQEAKRRGMAVTLDTVMNPQSLGWEALAPALPFVDWMLPSESEAATLTGETELVRQAETFKSAGAKNVAIKRGAEGCAVFPAQGEPFTVPTFPVSALDALGAGDAWVAGFLLGLVRGWSDRDTAQFASAVGACAVTGYGATTAIRTEAETLAFLNRMV